MAHRKLFAGLNTIIASVVLVLSAGSAFAATSTTSSSSPTSTTSAVGGNALRVSPVRTDLTINAGTTQTVHVFVQNLTTQPAELTGVVDDFTAGSDETGQPNLLLNGQQAPTHSLKQFVAPISNFNLAPGAQQDVKVVITIPKGTAGGGYYGAVRFEPTNPAGGKMVNLSASVGSLILVKVPGNVVDKVAIASFDVRKNDTPGTFFTNGKNLTAVVRFQNQGNVQEEPFGKVVLKKVGGKQVALYEINSSDPRGNVLPDSIRRFTVQLTKVGSFGKYVVEGSFGYGSNGALLTASKTIYIVPVSAVIVAGVVVILLFFVLFGLPRLVARYNRRVIEKATSKEQ